MVHDRRAAGLALGLLVPLAPAGRTALQQQPPQDPPAHEQPAPPSAPATLSPEFAAAAAAYAAKVVASAHFVSGRTLQSVLDEEFAPVRPLDALLRPLLRFDVDEARRQVTCRLGSAAATAVATAGLGCTLVRPDVGASRLQTRGDGAAIETTAPDPAAEWPTGERGPAAARDGDGIDHGALARAIDAAFTEPPAGPRRVTRAVVVVHRGRLVAERYAAGYDATMALPGWSVSKTLVDALLGWRVAQCRLDPDAALPVPEWSAADDPRRQVRLQHLLAMTSGLEWRESYDDPNGDTLRMLFGSSDHAAVQAARPLVAPPGSRFVYASGTTNLLCRVLRTTFAQERDYLAYPGQLFARLGMRSAVLETDPSGTFVGSSYAFASARDWARLGLLYAQDGVWRGERLLPAGWVAATSTASPASDGRYGRQVWLNADPDGDGPRRPRWPELPADLLHMDGHEGQYVVVMPRDELVVVRLGCTKQGGFDVARFLADVHGACRR
jgi:CubicO group peptidase (beta-lactamase class C family)